LSNVERFLILPVKLQEDKVVLAKAVLWIRQREAVLQAIERFRGALKIA